MDSLLAKSVMRGGGAFGWVYLALIGGGIMTKEFISSGSLGTFFLVLAFVSVAGIVIFQYLRIVFGYSDAINEITDRYCQDVDTNNRYRLFALQMAGVSELDHQAQFERLLNVLERRARPVSFSDAARIDPVKRLEFFKVASAIGQSLHDPIEVNRIIDTVWEMHIEKHMSIRAWERANVQPTHPVVEIGGQIFYENQLLSVRIRQANVGVLSAAQIQVELLEAVESGLKILERFKHPNWIPTANNLAVVTQWQEAVLKFLGQHVGPMACHEFKNQPADVGGLTVDAIYELRVSSRRVVNQIEFLKRVAKNPREFMPPS